MVVAARDGVRSRGRGSPKYLFTPTRLLRDGRGGPGTPERDGRGKSETSETSENSERIRGDRGARMDRVWRHLHTPFELCAAARGLHDCEWQLFDADRAGCRRCSYIHVCSADSCSLVQTEESMVCEITGLCLVPKNFVQSQYSDCVGYQGGATTSETARVQLGEVRKVVQHVLASDRAEACRARTLEKVHARMHSCLQAAIASAGADLFNAVAMIEGSLSAVCQRVDIPCALPAADMARVVEACAREICMLMSIAYYKLRMPTRPSDMRDNVVGLLFLMRTGITVHDVCVLPRLPLLRFVLPIENMLPKVFGIQSKTVTDVENRYKMNIRQLSRQQLWAAGFNGVQHEHTLISSCYTTLSCLLPRSPAAAC